MREVVPTVDSDKQQAGKAAQLGMRWIAVAICGIGVVVAITSWTIKDEHVWWAYVLKGAVAVASLAGLGAAIYMALT